MLGVLKTLFNEETNFLSNSNFDRQMEVIDTRNLVFFLPIEETFSYFITYTEKLLKKRKSQERETNPIRAKFAK